MAILTKADILGAQDLPSKTVEVPEWGGEVLVRGLTGTERDSFEMRMAAANKSGNTEGQELRAALAARCIVNEEGVREFTDKEVGQLGKKSGAALDRIFDEIRKLSGMTKEAPKEAAEDFGEAAGDDSPTV